MELRNQLYLIIDKGELRKDYVCHIFRYILSSPKSTYNCFIYIKNGDWDIGTEVSPRELIQNATANYNNTLAKQKGLQNTPRMLKFLY